MKERILYRKYKKKFTLIWIFIVHNAILLILLGIIGSGDGCNNYCTENIASLFLLIGLVAIVLFIYLLAKKSDPKNYDMVEITGDIIKPKNRKLP